jgi:hypothetical protein
VILELQSLQQKIISGHKHLEWQAQRLASWIGQYVYKNAATLKCNEVIAIGGLALSLPISDPELAEAFTPIWEVGGETDATKVPTAMLASVHHWRDQIGIDKEAFRVRVTDAIGRQPWAGFGGSSDLVAAGFAAAYAMMGEHSLAAAHLSGWRIRGSGISFAEGFGVLLLSFEANRDLEKANRFLHYYGDFCREIDPITACYLSARGIPCWSQYYGGPVQQNLNRQALFAEWSRNSTFFEFVKRVVAIASRRSDHPPIFEISRPICTILLKSLRRSEPPQITEFCALACC